MVKQLICEYAHWIVNITEHLFKLFLLIILLILFDYLSQIVSNTFSLYIMEYVNTSKMSIKNNT